MKAGRHRSFDEDIALGKAMEVFWTNGYSGTSLIDLTQAMGINKPSLYSAFGNKEALFKKSLDMFVQKYGTVHAKYLFEVDVCLHDRLQQYLTSIVNMATNPQLPGGCFVCNSTTEMSGECVPTGALQAITKINDSTKKNLLNFFDAEHLKGNLRGDSSPAVLASYLLTLQFGLATMARYGVAHDELSDVIAHSLTVV
ncbi:MAG: TetR/AcrR family transcriptional regulator [Ectothiorhodospiraceae bacterium]|nr:TetR/AcrR family transcriptional regulator [Ectothiorhodospiraceae bacterium]